jgi:metal-dependent amidase/aminoacylase/carboxypeptidase family protein
MAEADTFGRVAALDDAAAGLRDQLIAWQHYLHANPELPNGEERTGAFIAGRLREAGSQFNQLTGGPQPGHGHRRRGAGRQQHVAGRRQFSRRYSSV